MIKLREYKIRTCTRTRSDAHKHTTYVELPPVAWMRCWKFRSAEVVAVSEAAVAGSLVPRKSVSAVLNLKNPSTFSFVMMNRDELMRSMAGNCVKVGGYDEWWMRVAPKFHG